LAPDRRIQASRAARALAEHYSEERNWREMRAIFEKEMLEREAAA